MTNTPPTEVLEARAAEQRRELHNSVTELRSSLRQRLDLKRTTREHLAPAAGATALIGLVLGYTLTAIFTD